MKRNWLWLLLPCLVSCSISSSSVDSTSDYREELPSFAIQIPESQDYEIDWDMKKDKYKVNSTVYFKVNVKNEDKSVLSVVAKDTELTPNAVGQYAVRMPYGDVPISIRLRDNFSPDTSLSHEDFYVNADENGFFDRCLPYLEDEKKDLLYSRTYPIYDSALKEEVHSFKPGDKIALYKENDSIQFGVRTPAKEAKGEIRIETISNNTQYYFQTEETILDTAKPLEKFLSGNRIDSIRQKMEGHSLDLPEGKLVALYSDAKTENDKFRIFCISTS